MLSFSPSANGLQASSKQNSSGLGIAAIIGIIVAVVVVLLITVAILTSLYLSEKADKKSAFSTCRISCPGRQGDPARGHRYHYSYTNPPLIPVLRALTLLPTLTAAQTAFIYPC